MGQRWGWEYIRSALSPFLFAIVMARQTDKMRQESPWTVMFMDDMMCSESRKKVEENLERGRYAPETRGIKNRCNSEDAGSRSSEG